MEITASVPIATMLALGGIALLVLCLDRRRARLADRGHRAVIARSMGELNDMATHVMLGVRDLDTYESDETVPERLTQYLARNYRRAESLASAIELHGAMCTTLSGREKKDIETTARFARWLLDNYHPQDVREETRHRVWTRHPPDKLKRRASEMHLCVSRFTGEAAADAPA